MRYRLIPFDMVDNDVIIVVDRYLDGYVYNSKHPEYKYSLDTGRWIKCENQGANEIREGLKNKSMTIDQILSALHQDELIDEPYPDDLPARLIAAFMKSDVDGDMIIKDLKASGYAVPNGLKIVNKYLGGWEFTYKGKKPRVDDIIHAFVAYQN